MSGAGFNRDERYAMRERARAIKSEQTEKKIAQREWITRTHADEDDKVARLQQELRELRSIIRILMG